MIKIEGDIEEMAQESARDRREHADRAQRAGEIEKRQDAERLFGVMLELVDIGIDPVVIAKTALIGDRDGGMLYTLSVRAVALGEQEAAAQLAISAALHRTEYEWASELLAMTAAWLASQKGVSDDMLAGIVRAAARRPFRSNLAGCGAVDIVDNAGIDRARLINALELSKLSLCTPLEFSPS